MTGPQKRIPYFPVDFVRAQIAGIDVDSLRKNRELNWIAEHDQDTGFQTGIEKAEFDGLRFEIAPSGRAILSGSWHKFHNGGAHNWNDFDSHSFDQIVARLRSLFGIEPHNLRIIQIEFGVNLRPPLPPSEILNHCLRHNRKAFNRSHDRRGIYMEAEHDHYSLKIYDKGTQYSRPEHLIRIEVKVHNWTAHRAQGIETMQDWIEADKYPFLTQLVGRWHEVIFYDPTIASKRWQKYRDPLFWSELEAQRTPTTVKRHRDKLREICQTHGQQTQKTIADLIIAKVQDLQPRYEFQNTAPDPSDGEALRIPSSSIVGIHYPLPLGAIAV